MSEYIEIETELSDEADLIYFYTNLTLAEGDSEVYDSPEAMEEGSPVAQALAQVEGIRQARIEKHELHVTREPDTPWHILVADVSAALKDFFL